MRNKNTLWTEVSGRALLRYQQLPGSILAAALALGAATGLAGHAQAQDDGSIDTADAREDQVATLGTITVVARKRAADAQDVPDAISVLSQSVIEAGGLDEVSDFVELVPNATFTQDSETSSEISIRGSSRNLADEDPSVGIYRDGVYIGGLLFRQTPSTTPSGSKSFGGRKRHFTGGMLWAARSTSSLPVRRSM